MKHPWGLVIAIALIVVGVASIGFLLFLAGGWKLVAVSAAIAGAVVGCGVGFPLLAEWIDGL